MTETTKVFTTEDRLLEANETIRDLRQQVANLWMELRFRGVYPQAIFDAQFSHVEAKNERS